MESLPTEFDLIVVGTGLIESTVSAAASRIGKRVLHIDSKDYYGGLWASFNLENIQNVFNKTALNKVNISQSEDQSRLTIGNTFFDVKDIEQSWHIPEKLEEVEQECKAIKEENDTEEKECCVDNEEVCEENQEGNEENQVEAVKDLCVEEEVWSQEKIMKDSRKFNLDLAPKLQFARGKFVKMLVSSNIARYAEYISICRILTYLNGELVIVPCSRSNIFSCSHVSVIEKRMLMKLLTTIMDSKENEFSEYEAKTFKQFLKERKLSDNLIHYIIYSIALSNCEISCLDGVKNVKRFLESLGFAGHTPFLYSMYGSGEIPQAFCRLSAVFGGTYALNQPLTHFSFDEDNNFDGLISGNQKISASNLVTGFEYAPTNFIQEYDVPYITRGIFITNKTIMEGEKQKVSLILFPSEDEKDLCFIIEAGFWSGVCPKGLYVVHMTMKRRVSAKDDLKYYTEKLFSTSEGDNKPNILWSFYYAIPNTNDLNLIETVPKNAFFCPGPDLDLDYDYSIEKAIEIFEQLYPGSEVLPRAPDPEEIVISDVEDDEKAIEDVNDDSSEKLEIAIANVTEKGDDSGEIN